MSTTMQLGIALGFSGAAALKGFSNLSKTANEFKAQIEKIKGSQQLISDLKSAEKELKRLKSQTTTRFFTSGTEAQIKSIRTQLKLAGVDTNNLKQATRELNAVLSQTRFSQSQEAFSQAQSKVLGATALGYTVARPVMTSAKLEDDAKDISITGEFDAVQEASLSSTIRKTALEMNQTTDAVSAGLKTLVAGGIQSADELNRYAPVLAKTATATRAQMDDISDTFLAMANNMNISADESESAMNIMVKSTKLGQVEMRDAAKWMPKLTPMLKDLGVTGKEGVALLSSALQIAKIGAGTADEAGNNLVNFLTKINAPDTRKDFEKVGIDLDATLKESALNGIDPITAMLGTVEAYMSKALSPEDLAKYQAALAEKDTAKSAEMFKSLSEAGNMGQLFQDMQAMSALRAMLQNKDKFKSFIAQSLAAGNTDLLGADFDKRTSTLTEQWKGLTIAISEFSLSVGSLFLEPIKTLTGFIKSAAVGVGNFVKNNPELAKFTGYVLAGVAAFKVLAVGVLLVKGAALATAGAFTVLKLALLTNPVTAIMVGIGAAAYLLYENFGQIKSLFSGFWDGFMVGFSPVMGLFDGVGANIANLITSITGIKIATDESSFGWQVWGESLGMTLGGAISAITDFIGQIIFWFWSLPDNIKQAFEGLKQWFNSLWQDILSGIAGTVNSAKETLNSVLPDSLKLSTTAPVVPKLDPLTVPKLDPLTVPKLDPLTVPKLDPLTVPDVTPSLKANAQLNNKAGDTIHFSPNITLPPGTPEATVSTVKQALTMSQAEFEQRYKTMQRNNQRLNWSTP